VTFRCTMLLRWWRQVRAAVERVIKSGPVFDMAPADLLAVLRRVYEAQDVMMENAADSAETVRADARRTAPHHTTSSRDVA
jgi:hypothetical protein